MKLYIESTFNQGIINQGNERRWSTSWLHNVIMNWWTRPCKPFKISTMLLSSSRTSHISRNPIEGGCTSTKTITTPACIRHISHYRRTISTATDRRLQRYASPRVWLAQLTVRALELGTRWSPRSTSISTSMSISDESTNQSRNNGLTNGSIIPMAPSFSWPQAAERPSSL